MRDMKSKLELIGLVVAVVGGLGGFAGMIGAFAVLPNRVLAVEAKIEQVSRQREADHELLTRIEERLINVQMELRRTRP